jgi:hypothetical protein
MKKIISTIASTTALFLGLAFTHQAAQASSYGPMTCQLTFDAQGGGLQLGIGYYKLKGNGVVQCQGYDGQIEELPVRVQLGGRPLAARVGLGYMKVVGTSESFDMNGSIYNSLGNYTLLGTGAALGVGVEADLVVNNPRTGVRMILRISGVRGLGFDAGVSNLTIEEQ